MIETHAHIYDDQFDEDRGAMLQRAFDAGIKQIWMPNCDHETIDGMLALEQQYPGICLPMMGVHPCYIKENFEQELNIIENWLSQRKFPMIGEIGIDFYWDLSYVAQQEEAFIAQLRLAQKYNLPICIHSRNSKNGELNAIVRCIELIEQFGWSDLRGIFHCFSGNLEEAQRVISLNFLLGIGGVATFKNGGMDKVLPSIDLQHIVLETDSPYLAPVPHRGKRNEVAYIELVARRIAELKQISFAEVVNQTTINALNLIQK
ncbi:TatD family hydrolase [Emticicia soli]|uniref:TatD family hydrolase n=1 Tax=Emticicia soli TaxID=2027878 RepID=A0ABW5J897_9BACT